MLNFLFYKYTDKPNIIQKNIPTLGRLTLQGTLKNNFDLLNPVIVVRKPNEVDMNVFLREYTYVNTQIATVPRWYFITKKVILNNNAVELHLHLDVLYTYQSLIRNCTGTLIESDTGNNYLSTYSKIYDVRKDIQKINFSTGFNTDENIIMITTKGKITNG